MWYQKTICLHHISLISSKWWLHHPDELWINSTSKLDLDNSSSSNIKVPQEKGKKKYKCPSRKYWCSYFSSVCLFLCMSVHACAAAAAALWQWNTARRTGWIIPNTIKGSSTGELRPWQQHIQRISSLSHTPWGQQRPRRNGWEMGENDERRDGKRGKRGIGKGERKVKEEGDGVWGEEIMWTAVSSSAFKS